MLKSARFNQLKRMFCKGCLWLCCLLNWALGCALGYAAEIYQPDSNGRMILDRFGQMESHLQDWLKDTQQTHQWVNFGNSGTGGLWISHQYPEAVGTLVLVHGAEQYPNWPHLLEPIRTFLPGFGWNTLSVLLAIESNTPNLNATFQYLQNRQAENPIVVLLHKESAFKVLGQTYTDEDAPAFPWEQIEGVILLDALMPASQFHAVHQSLINTEKPILDVITQTTRSDISSQAQDRRTALSRRKAVYHQWWTEVPVSLDKAEDFRVADKIRGWLRRYIRQQQRPILNKKMPSSNAY
jgi:pimeloyl-ACP methyl ester carboxylesterase